MAVNISGEMKKWHKVTLTFEGPKTSELADPNPFLYYRLNLTFTHAKAGKTYFVPGYFAADGNAANTSAESGNKWRVHFCPDEEGKWDYTVSFRKGENISVNDKKKAGKSAAFMDGKTGSFDIKPTDKKAQDFRSKGQLKYVGKHHLRFVENGEYFLKCGSDAPETFLAYEEFDGTTALKANAPLKKYGPHIADWKPGDPTWKDGKGKGIIGAINYLGNKGINAISFLTYNAGGDGNNVWPFAERNNKLSYDCSKLDQWQIVMEHAQRNGLYLNYKTQETENDDNIFKRKSIIVRESLDGGEVGTERKLYYRELIARFSHNLVLNWNLGEENSQTTEQQKAMAAYFAGHDPYKHHIVLHTAPGDRNKVYKPLLGNPYLTGLSLQNGWKQTHRITLQWVRSSAKTAKPWVVANDEQGPAKYGVPPDIGYKGYNPESIGYSQHDIRKQVLWGNIMAGGAGVEYYFGYKLPENDLLCQDFRSRDKSWDYGRIAIEFFYDNNIPFWDMTNHNSLIGNNRNKQGKYCLAKVNEIYVIYLGDVESTRLDLGKSTKTYRIEWFNPRTGGKLIAGTILSISGPGKHDIGKAPEDTDKDWIALIRKDMN